VASGAAFDIRFSAVAGNQVRVDITKGAGGSPAASEVATGSNLHQALYRAADIAVEKTNGLGLKGFSPPKSPSSARAPARRKFMCPTCSSARVR
jgi:TolB protein